MTSVIVREFETFSESVESRLLHIEEQINGARDSHTEKIGDDNSGNAFCFNSLKNRFSELESQIIEKDAIINFLANQSPLKKSPLLFGQTPLKIRNRSSPPLLLQPPSL